MILLVRQGGVEGPHQIGDGGVLPIAVVLYLHQPDHIGVEPGDGADDLGALQLELGHRQGASVAAGRVGITPHHCGEEVEHVEARHPQIPRSGQLRGLHPIPAAVIHIHRGDPVVRHQPVEVIGVADGPFQVAQPIADAQIALLGIEGGIPGQDAIRRLGIGLDHQLIQPIALGPLARLLAHGREFLGRLDERRAVGQHQVVALAIVVEAEVAGDHQAGLGHQPHPHPLVALQQGGQALARRRYQIHRRHQAHHGLGHRQGVGAELGLVVILLHLAGDTHLGPGHQPAGLAALHEQAVGAGGIAVPLRVLDEESFIEAAHDLGYHPAGGIGGLGFELAGRHQRAAITAALNGRYGDQLVHRTGEDRRLCAIAALLAAATQAAHLIPGEALVFRRRVEGGLGPGAPQVDAGLAPQRHIQGRDGAGHPGGARIHPDLAQAVDYLVPPIEHQPIVAVEHQVAAELVGLGQGGGQRRGVGQHQAGAGGQGPLQGQAVGRSRRQGAAVGVEGQPVLTEIDRAGAEIAQLQRLVVAGSFQIFGDEQLCLHLSRQCQPDRERQQRVSS
ncbi:hypothetical protein D3C78_724180 [compost metagenome]